MARTAESYRRGAAKYSPQPKVLIVCEDLKSSRDYIKDAARYFRVDVIVDVDHCGKTDPDGIVKNAASRKSSYEYVFCVIDRDTHDNFEAAVRRAKESNVSLYISYPSFEYWLILHFLSNQRPYSRVGGKSPADCLEAELKKIPNMSFYDKGKTSGLFGMLLGEPFNRARKESPRILKVAREIGNMNPSTQMHELIDFLERLSKPQPL